MKIIQSNPYRVLGVYSNAPTKEIIGAENKIKAHVKVGRTLIFKTDFTPLLGEVERTEESLARAVSSLTLAKDKVRYALFWFYNENAFDEVAFKHLASGNIDSAIDILRKKTTVSAYINLAVCSLIKRQWANALYCYSQLLDNNRLDVFISTIAGEETVISKNEIASIIINSLESYFPEVNWLFFTKVKLINLGSDSVDVSDILPNTLLVKELKDRYVEKISVKINEKITEADKVNRKAPAECLSAAKNLSRLSSDFKSLRSVIGKTDIRYSSLSDKVADLLNDLCIGYYNHSTDNRKARVVFPFVKDALSYACSDSIIETCKKGFDFISEKIELLPPEAIEKECQEIENHLSNYADKGNVFMLLNCIISCQNILSIMKNKIGENNKEYINQSSLVVHFAINQIVDEINEKQKAYNDAPDHIDAEELNAYRKSLIWAKSVMDKLVSFAKDEKCKDRFNENNKTLLSLYNRFCVTRPVSSRPAGPTRPVYTQRTVSRPNSPQPPRPSNSSTNKSDNSNYGCIIGIVIAVIIFFVIIIVSSNNTSSSTSSNSNYVYDTIPVDTVVDDSEYEYSDSYDDNTTSYENNKSQYDIWLEQYKGNSLKTGATPYRSVYGGNSNSGNAGLKIKAPTSCDVLVIIKRGGNVVKHAYIRSNQTYSFTLKAGTYQPFFIFGNSWCPEKESPNGQLGYFLEDVSISKDYPQEIGEFQELQYTLQAVTNGNFHAASSDESEAF